MPTEEHIEYRHDGDRLEGFLAAPEGRGGAPAVLIAHPWAGRVGFVCDKARDLAALGYTAFALDLFGQGVIGQSKEENRRLIEPFLNDRSRLQGRMVRSLETLCTVAGVETGRVAAIGYCFGGLCVLDLARIGTPLAGVVSIHGLLGPPGNTDGTPIAAPVLVQHGHLDPMAPVEDVLALERELTGAGADWQLHVYGKAMHAFTNPQANDPAFGTVYEPDTDRRAWRDLTRFLEEVL